jgi:hypothetical protein
VSAERCKDCGSAHEPAQRYCLGCGTRLGARDPLLGEVLRRVGERLRAADAIVDGAPRPASRGASAPAAQDESPSPHALAPMPAVRLMPAKFFALLLLMFVGFGVIIGGAAGSRPSGSLAASARRLKIVLPSSTTADGPGSTTGASAPAAASEAPESEPASTPAATPAESSPTVAPKAPSSATTGSPAPPSPGEGGGSGSPTHSSGSRLPPIKHVFVVMLADQPYASVFGPASPAHYLAQTLPQRGELLVRYDAIAHEELANELALLSGQGPTAETAANCPNYAAVAPASSAAAGQVLGSGCVYPPSTRTLAGQLSAKHLTWRAYVEGFAEPGTQTSPCAHPALGAADPTSTPGPSGEAYATFRNPFVYFQSITGSKACAADDVGLDRLRGDLASPARTPSFSYIVPDRCHDASPTPCAPGAAAGPAAADTFVKAVVPEILGSAAYKDGGLLVITVDEAPSSGEFADSSSCCGQPRFPNLPAAPGGFAPRGGGTVGALLLSPFIKGATTSQEPYNHFSLLRTIEDLFGLGHLGYAGLPKVTSLEASTFSAYTPH